MHAHKHFCTCCKCTRSHHTYNDYNSKTWIPGKDEECWEQAEKFQDAPSQEEVDELFKYTALQFSELLRLLYYKPSTFLVVDVMHNFFLGLIKRHFQEILGYRENKKMFPAVGICMPKFDPNDDGIPTEKKQ